VSIKISLSKSPWACPPSCPATCPPKPWRRRKHRRSRIYPVGYFALLPAVRILIFSYAFGILTVRFLIACPVRCVVCYLTGARTPISGFLSPVWFRTSRTLASLSATSARYVPSANYFPPRNICTASLLQQIACLLALSPTTTWPPYLSHIPTFRALHTFGRS
jgi:hypothetical protein